MVELRAIIKSNLFVQTMTNNQLGFTCGHLFYITKYKYNELILMNIPLILMFYKLFSRNLKKIGIVQPNQIGLNKLTFYH
ncbi:hypothetical protein DERF_011937 [Dermatophagoides farinae]|uniref:Uncharacterized protein n=1 Tax=Dermatophagoides farinae TaxID=6954 RepID=A0A922HQZ6_DERFA|nr:hypothetical protein DERF_011937 [Dermatophagoides farinae]